MADRGDGGILVAITFIEPDETLNTVEAEVGMSLMEAAVKGCVKGIIAECGGVCSCGTCRIYIEEERSRKSVGPPTSDELDMMQFVGETRQDARLSCQLSVTPDLDSLVVRVASKQRGD